MKVDTKRRLSALEKILVPPDNWEITAEYISDGHTAKMSARAYLRLKEQDPAAVRIVDRHITGNLKELDAYLEAAVVMAEYVQNNDVSDEVIYI